MVNIGRRSGLDSDDSSPTEYNLAAAMTTERSRTNLHNFSLPSFKWGEQRQLRCVKLSDNGSSHQSPPPTSMKRRRDPIEAETRKLMLDFQAQVDGMKSAALSDGSEEARPWNLRNRRGDDRKPSFAKSPARRSELEGGDGGERRPRARLRVPLSKMEIEEDFVAMTGIRPPRKPKKRPRHVQKQIDRFLPGFWLSEIRASMYKVNENAEVAKS